MLDLRARNGAARVVEPLARGLARLGASPTAVTVAGLAITVAGSVMVGASWLLLGAALILAGGGFDLLDGALARLTGSATPRGAMLDSVTDRIGETAIWAGLAYYSANRPTLVALCAVALGNSLVISYLRSKAEAGGAEGRGGWMGRSERLLLYVAGVASGLFAVMLWIMVALTSLTVVQRFHRVWTQLEG